MTAIIIILCPSCQILCAIQMAKLMHTIGIHPPKRSSSYLSRTYGHLLEGTANASVNQIPSSRSFMYSYSPPCSISIDVKMPTPGNFQKPKFDRGCPCTSVLVM